jgi:hypothetical protein
VTAWQDLFLSYSSSRLIIVLHVTVFGLVQGLSPEILWQWLLAPSTLLAGIKQTFLKPTTERIEASSALFTSEHQNIGTSCARKPGACLVVTPATPLFFPPGRAIVFLELFSHSVPICSRSLSISFSLSPRPEGKVVCYWYRIASQLHLNRRHLSAVDSD